MKIAIPTFASRVSPRFDCARSVLLVSVDDDGTAERAELTASDWTPHERINKLVELGVDTVICGGIDCWSVASFQSAGVTVYGWITGEADDALASLLDGNLDSVAGDEEGGRCGCRRFPADDCERGQLSATGRGRRRRRGGGGGGSQRGRGRGGGASPQS